MLTKESIKMKSEHEKSYQSSAAAMKRCKKDISETTEKEF
jgi:hypothetical protein